MLLPRALSTFFFASAALLISLRPAHCEGPAAATDPVVIPVDSPAFVFSPGNWSSDTGRTGSDYRQTWNSGAYFRVTWTTTRPAEKATLLLDTTPFGDHLKEHPFITYNIDGVWKADVPVADEIPIEGLAGPGTHTLTVYLQRTQQSHRWGTPGHSAANVLRVRGLQVDPGSTPVPSTPAPKWLLIVGDSITEGIGTDGALSAYSHLIGQALQTQGYEYAISACGYSGWIRPGDNPPDVPAYYAITGSTDGNGGTHDDTASRWNKIDANTSLLDSAGRLSAYGQPDQAPAAILINYGTNEAISAANKSDLRASITQGLTALRTAAPQAHIFLLVPFGQFSVPEIKTALAAYQQAHPTDHRITLIDLGPQIRRGMSDDGYWSGIHPNLRAHATFATQVLAAMQPHLLSNTGEASPAKTP